MDTGHEATLGAALGRRENRAYLAQCAHDIAVDIRRIETDDDKLSVLMTLGALVAEVAALAVAEPVQRSE